MAAPAAAAAIGTAAEVKNAVSSVKPPRVRFRQHDQATRPVITCIVIVAGAGFLHTWVVERKTMPERKFFVRLAILGFVLSLLAETAPKLGKSMAYLVMTAVIFERSQAILNGLRSIERGDRKQAPSAPGNPLFPEARPIVLYQRTGPLSAPPNVPNRPRARRPERGPFAGGSNPYVQTT